MLRNVAKITGLVIWALRLRAIVLFTILLNSRAEDSDAGYDRDDDWKPKVGTDNI